MREFIFRVAVAPIVSAIFCAAAVFFVVDMSLRGLETASARTGERIDDVNVSITELKQDMLREFERLENQNDEGFDEVSGLLREAQLEQQEMGFALGASSRAIDASAISVLGIMMMILNLPDLSTSLAISGTQAAAVRADLKRDVRPLCTSVLSSSHPECANIDERLRSEP